MTTSTDRSDVSRRDSEVPDRRETQLIKHRYDRVAPFYDTMEWVVERLRFSKWRPDIWQAVEGDTILEVGVGTGKNFEYYPEGRAVTALDISPKMLEQAGRRADELGVDVQLVEGDAQALPFEDDSFESAVTTFVFCSVPDPIQGLSELRRVLEPGGQLLMLEHVLSQKPVIRTLMKWFDFFPYRLWGAHIDRDTVENTRSAGFKQIDDTDLSLDIVKRIEARSPR